MSPKKINQISSTSTCMIVQYLRCVSIRRSNLCPMSDLSRKVPPAAEKTSSAKVKYTTP
jgi:hypothetical protein